MLAASRSYTLLAARLTEAKEAEEAASEALQLEEAKLRVQEAKGAHTILDVLEATSSAVAGSTPAPLRPPAQQEAAAVPAVQHRLRLLGGGS